MSPRSQGSSLSHAEVDATKSSANVNQIKINVKTSRTYDGNAQEADFSLAIYINK